MVVGEGIAACPRLEHLHIRVSACNVYDYSVHPRYTVFSTVLPYASRTLRTFGVELAADPEWCYKLGDFEIWDLSVLDEYLTREPAEFPSLNLYDTRYGFALGTAFAPWLGVSFGTIGRPKKSTATFDVLALTDGHSYQDNIPSLQVYHPGGLVSLRVARRQCLIYLDYSTK